MLPSHSGDSRFLVTARPTRMSELLKYPTISPERARLPKPGHPLTQPKVWGGTAAHSGDSLT